MPASDDFTLSITRALGDQLETALSRLRPDRLTEAALQALEVRPGVYQLYHRDALVYVGKAAESLPRRLGQHLFKLSGRRNIALTDVGYTCLYVNEDMNAVAPETLLIERFRAQGQVPWNTNGFGNNDPGRQRDTSQVGSGHFDAQYPIDLDWRCRAVPAGSRRVADVLRELKRTLPYTFRFQRNGRSRNASHPDYEQTTITVPTAGMPAHELFALIARTLPSGWLVTALPGYVIMYQEAPRTYVAQIAQWP